MHMITHKHTGMNLPIELNLTIHAAPPPLTMQGIA
jgi:hypothetical protein